MSLLPKLPFLSVLSLWPGPQVKEVDDGDDGIDGDDDPNQDGHQ